MYCEEVKVLVAQLCLTLCDPMDYSPPGSSVHGILRARILEWVANNKINKLVFKSKLSSVSAGFHFCY